MSPRILLMLLSVVPTRGDMYIELSGAGTSEVNGAYFPTDIVNQLTPKSVIYHRVDAEGVVTPNPMRITYGPWGVGPLSNGWGWVIVQTDVLKTPTHLMPYYNHYVQDNTSIPPTTGWSVLVSGNLAKGGKAPVPTFRFYTLPPSAAPTISPSSTSPTSSPTTSPTISPTTSPTTSPTSSPSSSPTPAPTLTPSTTPTVQPTSTPTWPPTMTPTINPTLSPTSSAPTMTCGDVPDSSLCVDLSCDAGGVTHICPAKCNACGPNGVDGSKNGNDESSAVTIILPTVSGVLLLIVTVVVGVCYRNRNEKDNEKGGRAGSENQVYELELDESGDGFYAVCGEVDLDERRDVKVLTADVRSVEVKC